MPEINAAYYPELISPVRVIGSRTFDFSRQVAVMSIINRTPDSFHDKGRTFALDKALEAADKALTDGADWLDIGGVPFAPGPAVTIDEEIDRVVPVIEGARARTDAVISVETYRPEVARAAFQAGADVLNNTSGLHDPTLADAVAEANATLIVTHSLADPRTAYPRPEYKDVVTEVATFLRQRVKLAEDRGVPPNKLIIDPGHDLNKNTHHSLELTRRLPEIAKIGHPLLVAVSNKDFIGETLNKDQNSRLEGTLATLAASILSGARIVRVHDTKEAKQTTNMLESIQGWRPPSYTRHNT